MTNAQITEQFLFSVDGKTCEAVLSNVANHYGISVDETMDNLLDENAESLLDYMTGQERMATHLMMKRWAIRNRA